MRIEFDTAKRDATLEAHGLDFNDVAKVLGGFFLTRIDDRKDYGEVRHIVLGALDGRPVVVVWTPRADAVRVISIRIADDEEREIYWRERDRSR
ncbi:BrnT family toxin [Sphingomonas naphthae]|uniref:BrnT family toxin n=1 Tax=Sphingomonas naphthae TaxID=1813468 RepID=A0ABY7TH52_9SPHN|nr:BrnT family toxin [Sphingomonas naphthae]WCT72146.1 BrnT family toxin [Sphingomonas naphthae]